MSGQRREFIKQVIAGAATGALTTGLATTEAVSRPKVARLGAYYFRAHLYTLVPKHVREDLDWMKRLGTTDLMVAVLEQDLFAAKENLAFIITEAHKRNIKVWAVPSRWGGLVAGAPKVPSLFSVTNPSTWALLADGKPRTNQISGVISSVYDPATKAFMIEKGIELLNLLPFEGLIWDEPKSFDHIDYHPESLKLHGPKPKWEAHVDAVANFWSEVNTGIKAKHPTRSLAMFIYASAPDYIIKAAASVKHLDYFGADGRPWADGEGQHLEAKGKTLLDKMPIFTAAAQAQAKQTLFLIENHNMVKADYQLMAKRLPDILKLKPDFLLYYYYPRNLEDPEQAMKALVTGLK